MNRLDRLDRSILSHCLKDHAPLSELLACIPRGTLYRHVEKLLAAGLLAKHGAIYTTTEHGKCRLAELSGLVNWDIWDDFYPPIRHVPTRPHRAMFELTTSAVAARKARVRDDHHPGFVYAGPPLSWKTTQAMFQCHALGLDPCTTIIDLTTESGRSLLVRRDGKGNVLFKRHILDSTLICFDDLLEVQPSLRPVLHHFLSGRIVIPVENTTLCIEPVPIITLNPKDKSTLEEQTSFSTAQLRRLVVLNLNKVRLPDLATMGHRALEAAIKYGPIQLPAPTIDAQAYRPHIVALTRETLIPNVWAQVDTEMLATLVSGMSAFIPDPERAIQQTLYDFLTTAETLEWTTSGWSQAISRFSLHAPLSRRQQESKESASRDKEEKDHIIIWRHAMEGYRESALPPFTISDGSKARLIAVASQENIPLEHVDHALGVILDWWNQQQREGRTLDEVYSVLQLAKDLGQRTIAVQDVRFAMRLRQAIQDGSYSSKDFQTALDLLPLLQEHGLTAEDDRIETVVSIAARFLNSDRSLVELQAWLDSEANTRFQENDLPPPELPGDQ